MAFAVWLGYKAAGIETGGTNALTGLHSGVTPLSSGDAETTPLNTTALDTVFTLYYWAADSSTGLDLGQDSATEVMPTLPAGWEGCATFGGTYSATPTLEVATGGYKPVFVKQVSLLHGLGLWATGHAYSIADRVYIAGFPNTAFQCVTGHTSGTWATDLAASKWRSENIGVAALDPATGTRVAQVGTVTPTAASGQVSLAWSAVSGAASYDLYHSATNSAPAYGAAATVAGVTSGVVVSGLTNGTVRYFWVRANAATGAGAWSAVASATPAGLSRSTAGLIYDETWADATHWVNLDANIADHAGSSITAVSGKGRAHGATGSATACQFACSSVPTTTTDQFVQYRLPDVTNQCGVGLRFIEITQPSANQGSAGNGTYGRQNFYLACYPAAKFQAYKANTTGFYQRGTDSTGAPSANDLIAAGVVGSSTTSNKLFVNGTEITNCEASTDTSGTAAFTAGSAGIRFQPAAANGYSDYGPMTFMKPNGSGKIDVSVTGLPTGYKVSLTGQGQAEGSKVTSSAGNATLTYNTAGPSGGAVDFRAGGATLKVYNGSDTLMLTQTGVYGGDTWAWG